MKISTMSNSEDIVVLKRDNKMRAAHVRYCYAIAIYLGLGHTLKSKLGYIMGYYNMWV